jgi:osmotically-inducible protein OsmY
MTIGTLSREDTRTRDAVLLQLEWDSQVDASGIGVTAHNNIVTLTGIVGSYAEKLAAERAAKRVHGVRGVANDVQVRLKLARTDSEIAANAVRALDLRAALPDSIQAVVHNGHLTLTGVVPTLFHRTVAEKAVRHIRGLKATVNRITVTPAAAPRDIRHEIARALHRDATIHGRGIEVTVDDHKVTLRGQVASWHERESAERAAMHATGIAEVDNQIDVAWPAVGAGDFDD